MAFLNKFFGVRQGEGIRVFLLSLYSFLVVSAFIIARIISGSIFLSRSGVKNLPYLYLLVALVVAGITLAYQRFGGKLRLDKDIIIVTFLLLAGILSIRGALGLKISWAPAALYVFAEVMGGMLIIQFGTFLNETLNTREVKRLGSLIWGGGVMANLVSFPMRAFSKYMEPENFLYFVAAALAAILLIVRYLGRDCKGALEYSHSTRHLSSSKKSGVQKFYSSAGASGAEYLKSFKKLSFGISALVCISILTVTLIDYQYKVSAKGQFSDPKSLTDFFFAVNAYSGMISIFIQFVVFKAILEKFGILYALLALPATLFAGSATSFAAGGAIAVWAIYLSQGSQIVFRYTMNDPTIKMLYQPLTPAIRRKAMAIDGGIVRPISQGLGGVVALAAGAVLIKYGSESIVKMSSIVAALCLVWGMLVFASHKAYIKALVASSHRKAKDPSAPEGFDYIPAFAIKNALASGDAVQAYNAIELLMGSKRSDFYEPVYAMLRDYNKSLEPNSTLPKNALYNASARALAIAYLGSTKRADYVEHIEKRFDDEDDECLANAVAAYCNLTQERCAPTINRFLSHQDPKVKAAAIAGLIRYGGLEGILISASALKEMIESGSPEQRKNAAVVLGLIKIQSFHQSVLKLMDDRDPEVRRQGAAAAGELGSPELLPRLLELLGDGYVHSTAVKALSRRGAEILDDLVKLYENPASNRMQRLGAVKTLASIRSQEAFDALIKALPEKDEKLESAIINALAHARLKRPDIIVDAPKVRSLIHAQFSVFYQKLLDEESAAKFLPSKLLDDTIKDNRRLALTSIYGLLSLIYPPRMIEVIAYDLKSSNASIRANALEIIDNAFDSEIRTLLLAAVDNVSLQTKLEQAEKFFRLKEKSPDELVEEFLSSSDSWLAASALNAIAENGLREFSAKARDFLKSEDPLLRETALFVMSRFETAETLAAAAREAAQDPDSTVRAYAKSFAA